MANSRTQQGLTLSLADLGWKIDPPQVQSSRLNLSFGGQLDLINNAVELANFFLVIAQLNIT